MNTLTIILTTLVIPCYLFAVYMHFKKKREKRNDIQFVSNTDNKNNDVESEKNDKQHEIPSVEHKEPSEIVNTDKEKNVENIEIRTDNHFTEKIEIISATTNNLIKREACVKYKFMSLASGSSGNCFYLGTQSYGILIDAGIGIRIIRKVLREHSIALETILGIFVTHDHDGHIRGVGNLSELFNIPVYATEMVHKGMQKSYCMTKKVSPVNRRVINKGESVSIRDFSVTPFEIPHDGVDNVGYSIQCGDVNFCFITDIGHITPTVCEYVAKSNYLILESNYDERMLAEGPYPPHLQARISGMFGHLSNREAGEFLASYYPPQLYQIWLCHLSKENNKPHLAYHAVASALESVGKKVDRDVRLMALPRTSPTQIFEFNSQGKEETKTLCNPKTDYTPSILGNEKEYPIVRYPSEGTAIFPYRRQSIHRKGYMDKPFMEYLNNVFGEHLLIMGNCGILPQNNSLPFEPDVAIIDLANPNIRIDIEIDEPYSAKERKPIHYIGCGDEFRDIYMNNLGWIVIRFAEKQVVSDMKRCAAFIARVMYSINPKMNFLEKFLSHSNPSPINRWTKIEAQIMECGKVRESYLEIEFGPISEKENTPENCYQTEEEKNATIHITPILLSSFQKQSFSPVLENRLVKRDQNIQFFPIEHIYLYKGIEKFVSASKLIPYFFNPFDSARWSEIKAFEKGISQEQMLEEWDETGVRSKEVGTFMHQQIENYFQGRKFNKEYLYVYKGRYINVKENISLEKEYLQFLSFLNTHNGITPHKIEWTIYDEELKIAGTIDLLHKHGDIYDIYDWKRSHKIVNALNEPIIDNDYQTKGINGLETVYDTRYWHYCIQQNLYRYILEKNYNIKIGKMYLVILHADYDNYCKFEVPKMDDVIDTIVRTCKNESLATKLCNHNY